MFMKRKNGQTTAEYVLLIVIAMIALVAIKGFATKIMEGRVKDSSDLLGPLYDTTGEYYHSWQESGDGNLTKTQELSGTMAPYGSGTFTQVGVGGEVEERTSFETDRWSAGELVQNNP